MKILLTLFVLFFSTSVVAGQYQLSCVSEKEFMIVFSVDENNKEIIKLLSKNLISGQEWGKDPNYHDIIFWEDDLVITLSKWDGSHTVNSYDLKNSNFISSGHYFNRNVTGGENNYTYNQYFECSRF